MKKLVLFLAVLALISGCGRADIMSEADGKMLCDPETGSAFFIVPHVGDVSFVRRVPTADGICAGDEVVE